MEIKGRILAVLEEKSGTSQRTGNNWRCGQYVLETIEQYPKKILFEVFGEEKIHSMNIHIGEELTVFFDVDAREYNGKWYNQIRAWKVERQTEKVYQNAQSPVPMEPFPPLPETDALTFENNNEPPF
ncbi:MAG: DUF3127 domain-containing protein [Bacteroidaceae bacterium]|jgi:hypothetical protein|nr:DUF3127 domain-containing protein [Bacteroidaceae bacterium]